MPATHCRPLAGLGCAAAGAAALPLAHALATLSPPTHPPTPSTHHAVNMQEEDDEKPYNIDLSAGLAGVKEAAANILGNLFGAKKK